MNATQESTRKRSVARTAFLGSGFVAVLFLGYKIFGFVQEARVAVNIGTGVGDNPKHRIVNKSDYAPPADGKLQLAQVDLMLHIIEATDTLAITASQPDHINRIVELLNEYTTSLQEYRWVRSTIAMSLTRASSRAPKGASPLGKYEGLTLGQFMKHKSFFTDSIDKALL